MSTAKLSDVPSLSVEDKLSGNIPGVSISSFSGQPGAMNYIRIRGMGSINAGNDPLIVIDGTPVNSGNLSGFNDGSTQVGYNGSGTNALSTLNSNDIESITVIKDAAAASLYGSRAANGVLVITTKSGSAGKTQVDFRSDWGFSNMAINYRPTLDGDSRRALIYQGLKTMLLIMLMVQPMLRLQHLLMLILMIMQQNQRMAGLIGVTLSSKMVLARTIRQV